jgi:Flp pilus assembly pilin Flp
MNPFTDLLFDEQGAALTEYALVLALLALAAIAALTGLSQAIGRTLNNVSSALTAASTGP